MFLPHEFYPSMVRDRTLAAVCLSPEVLHRGDGLGGLLRDWAAHEDVAFEGDLGSLGILGFHCDGVQYTSTMRAGGGRSIFVGSMNIVSPPDDRVRSLRQPLFVLRKSRMCACGCQGFHTFQELLAVLAWSMQCLATGVSPALRHDGTPWSSADLQLRMPGGQTIPRAALLQIRGDWEFLVQAFLLRSFSSDSFCWMCNAVQITPGPLHFSDFRPEAAHRATLIDHPAYFQACARERRQPSNLFQCPGTLIDHIAVDGMHAGDLGTFADAVGSLLWLE